MPVRNNTIIIGVAFISYEICIFWLFNREGKLEKLPDLFWHRSIILNTSANSFTEIQKFTQWWLWAILIGVSSLPFAAVFKQISSGEPLGTNPMPPTGLLIFFVGSLALILFFAYIELRTEIDQKGIRVRLRPIARNIFTWDQIEKVEPITYGFVGYGLRFSFKYGTVYNIGGNKGLAVYLKDGGRFVIGTQKPKAIMEAARVFGNLERSKK